MASGPRGGYDALSKTAMGRLAAALYLVSGVVTLVSPLLPSAPAVNRLGVMAIGIAAIALSPIVWVLPWGRWPRSTTLWTAGLLAQALVGLHNYFGGADPYRYGLFFMVSYIWVGLAQPRWSTFKLAPFTLVAYLAPLLAGNHPHWATFSVLYALPVFLLAGESIAWVSERLRDAQSSLTHQAFHDGLTGLPNRVQFQLRVDAALGRAGEVGQHVAVLFVDLDRFKMVNDTLGHDAGDELLAEVAERLRCAVRAEDVVARMGGDEFTVLLQSAENADEADAVAQRLLACFEEPFALSGGAVQVGASIGIAFAHGGKGDIESLLRNSDLAMYLAKDSGGRTFRSYESTMGAEAQARVALETDLRRGIDAGELRVLYQPVVELDGMTIVGCEALVRWQHPERGLIAPIEFLPLAEDTGLIVQVGEAVMATAIEQAATWWRFLGDRAPDVSVNVSAKELDRAGYAAALAQKLAASGLPPHKLVIEITESTMLRPCVTENALADLRALGVSVAIDDFGTGYSSLAYLKELPARALKLDRRFVAGLGTDAADEAIARSVITLAGTLGLVVTAEGVEREEQAAVLSALGCPTAQGFLFSRPVGAREISALLQLESGDPAPVVGSQAATSSSGNLIP